MSRKLILSFMAVFVLSSFGFAVVVEASSTGWSQTYGGTKTDCATSLVKTIDGGYAIAGFTSSFATGTSSIQDSDFWLVKTDEYGIVPEYSSWVLLSIMLVATFVIVIYKKKFFDDHP